MISWNGVTSDDLHVIVASHPKYTIPERKMEVVSVPGRSGDIIITQDAYENVTQEYDLALIGLNESLPQTVREVMEWLMKPTGYARLEDTYYPDTFRFAYFQGGVDIVNRFNTVGRAKVSFSCKPQRFLRIGEWPILASSGMKLTNQSVYTAKPLFIVKGTGTASITVGSYSMSISSIETEIDIDCETQNAYYGSTNKNNVLSVTNGKFPVLAAGDTQISWTGSGVTSVTIIPRWWTL